MDNKKSMINTAYDLMQKKKNDITFEKLWEEVSQSLGMSEEEAKKKIGSFYTNLTLDGRFITVGENKWNLRSRKTYDKVHIDMNDIYVEDDDEVTLIDDEEEVSELGEEEGEEVGVAEAEEEAEEFEDSPIDSEY